VNTTRGGDPLPSHAQSKDAVYYIQRDRRFKKEKRRKNAQEDWPNLEPPSHQDGGTINATQLAIVVTL
jgi:hypothetical protein